jgi:hypothetical protein
MGKQLKTLKDLRMEKVENKNDYMTSEFVLKQEAIKWAKELQIEQSKYYKGPLKSILESRFDKPNEVTNAQRRRVIQWIINFFNLTEEDLK